MQAQGAEVQAREAEVRRLRTEAKAEAEARQLVAEARQGSEGTAAAAVAAGGRAEEAQRVAEQEMEREIVGDSARLREMGGISRLQSRVSPGAREERRGGGAALPRQGGGQAAAGRRAGPLLTTPRTHC